MNTLVVSKIHRLATTAMLLTLVAQVQASAHGASPRTRSTADLGAVRQSEEPQQLTAELISVFGNGDRPEPLIEITENLLLWAARGNVAVFEADGSTGADTPLSVIPVGHRVLDMALEDNLLALTTDRRRYPGPDLHLFDLSRANTPTRVASLRLPLRPHYLAVDGPRLYAVNETGLEEPGTLLQVVDISDPTRPRHLTDHVLADVIGVKHLSAGGGYLGVAARTGFTPGEIHHAVVYGGLSTDAPQELARIPIDNAGGQLDEFWFKTAIEDDRFILLEAQGIEVYALASLPALELQAEWKPGLFQVIDADLKDGRLIVVERLRDTETELFPAYRLAALALDGPEPVLVEEITWPNTYDWSHQVAWTGAAKACRVEPDGLACWSLGAGEAPHALGTYRWPMGLDVLGAPDCVEHAVWLGSDAVVTCGGRLALLEPQGNGRLRATHQIFHAPSHMDVAGGRVFMVANGQLETLDVSARPMVATLVPVGPTIQELLVVDDRPVLLHAGGLLVLDPESLAVIGQLDRDHWIGSYNTYRVAEGALYVQSFNQSGALPAPPRNDESHFWEKIDLSEPRQPNFSGAPFKLDRPTHRFGPTEFVGQAAVSVGRLLEGDPNPPVFQMSAHDLSVDPPAEVRSAPFPDHPSVRERFPSRSALQGKRLHVDAGAGYIARFDLTEPLNPLAMPMFGFAGDQPRFPHQRDGGRLVATSFGLHVLADEGADDAALLAQWVPSRSSFRPPSPYMSGRYLFTRVKGPEASEQDDDFVQIRDAQDLRDPRLLGILENLISWTVSGDLLYGIRFRSYELVVYDLARPGAPVRLSRWCSPDGRCPSARSASSTCGIGGLRVDGDLLWFFTRYCELQSMDVSDPTNIRMLDRLAIDYDLSPNQEIARLGDRLLLPSDINLGADARTVDVSDPTNLGPEARFEEVPDAREIQIRDGHMLVLAQSWLRIYALASPEAPDLVGEIPLSSTAHNLRVADGTAYVQQDEAIHVIDIVDPRRPRLEGILPYPGLHGFGLAGDRIMVGAAGYTGALSQPRAVDPRPSRATPRHEIILPIGLTRR